MMEKWGMLSPGAIVSEVVAKYDTYYVIDKIKVFVPTGTVLKVSDVCGDELWWDCVLVNANIVIGFDPSFWDTSDVVFEDDYEEV